MDNIAFYLRLCCSVWLGVGGGWGIGFGLGGWIRGMDLIPTRPLSHVPSPVLSFLDIQGLHELLGALPSCRGWLGASRPPGAASALAGIIGGAPKLPPGPGPLSSYLLLAILWN